ncbi:MAG: Hydrogenase maturation factor HypB [Hyphomicrobiaceae bacterium hypho_1]
MCIICGCEDIKVQGHCHDGDHNNLKDLHFGRNHVGVEISGISETRLIEVKTDVLAKNNMYADRNRKVLTDLCTLSLNLISSPGSGKTTLLCRTIEEIGSCSLAVIEGDQQTTNDAKRIRSTGAQAVQVNTGKGCHLDGYMVGCAIENLELNPNSILFIENVGNLVCPAAFDLGEDAKVVILSVTEGEDKPLKYPDVFTASKLAILNKIDLAPHCNVNLELYEENLRRVNPKIKMLRLSARTGEGMKTWINWLHNALAKKSHGKMQLD